MKRILLILVLLSIIALMAPTGVVQAAPNFDRVVREGQVLDEDLVVVGGQLVIEEGAQVNGAITVYGGEANLAGSIDGDVSVFGGRTTLTGHVDGDLVIIGGNLSAGSAAAVDGDCILIGGNVGGDGQAFINCTAVGDLPMLAAPNAVRVIRGPDRSGSNVLGTIGSAAGLSLTLGLIALVVGSLAPTQLGRVSEAMTSKPAATGTVGLLTGVAAVSLIVLLSVISGILVIVCIGLLGFPIVLGLLALLIGGWVLGWVAAGRLLGEKVVRLLKMSNRTLPITAALGTVSLTLAAEILSSLPFFLGGWLWSLAALAVGFAGLGAVALTRFGTVPYPLPAQPIVPKSPAPMMDLPAGDDTVEAGDPEP